MFQTLMETGHDDVAYGCSPGKTFRDGDTCSRTARRPSGKHGTARAHAIIPALGCIDAWLYQALGGIRLDPTVPAFKHIVIKPSVVGDLAWVKCSYRSIQGTIATHWRREKGTFRLEVTIPVNTTATIWIPSAKRDSVVESGRSVSEAKNVKFLRTENAASVFEVGSGHYSFEAPLPWLTP